MEDIKKLVDENGIVLKNLVSDFGENNVKDLAEFLGMRSTKPIDRNQLRKFYDSFLKIYFSNSSNDSKKIQLLMLKAQAEYSERRLKIIDFKKFFANRIDLVVMSEDSTFKCNLEALKLHFEALVGYFPNKNES